MAEDIELKEGVKPLSGAPSNFGQGTTIRQLDDQGRIQSVRTSGAPLDTANVKTPREFSTPVRTGDYYFDNTGTLQVWQNSPTDLLQKHRTAVGGTEKPADLLRPGAEALSIAGGAAAGATALAIGGPAGMAVGGLVGGLIGGLSNLNATREEALKRWREQDVKYDSAVSFYKDDDGTVKYKVDYQKMGTGGERSGDAVKEAQTRETQVWLGDDGRLKIKVSPIFASTARYKEITDFISQNYAGLNKNTENLDETLTEIKDAINDEARDYVTNMKLYADFSHKFPNASPETIVSSYVTETAGYVDPTKMKDYQVTVLGDGDKATTQSAEQFFNSVLDMDKTKRNELAAKLNDIVYGDSGNFNDEQKAVAYGELQAMYAASANPEKYENNKYQGMMNADPFVSFMNSFSPLGLNVGDVLKFVSGGAYSKQEMLNQDEWAQFFGGVAGIGAGLGLWKGATTLIEKGLKLLPGTAQLYAASFEGHEGGITAFVAQNRGNTGAVAKAALASAAFKTIKEGVFDAALAGTKVNVSDADFWSEFGQDFARDLALEAIFSYYDFVQFQGATTDSLVRVYEDPKTGNMIPYRVSEGDSVPEQIILAGDGTPTEETFTSVGLSGRPEEFVSTGNGTSVYKLKGKANITRTRAGDVVGVYEDPNTTQLVINEKVYTIGRGASNGEGPALLETGDIGIDEFPAMSSGVVNVTPSSDADEISKIMTKMNLPADTRTWEVPESSANSAIVAGKIAKIQSTKFGMEIYKQLFNKNAVLDVANNMALAKDGDLNSWRNAQELFVSVANNAQRNLQDIQNGLYLKDAAIEWNKTIDVMGKFNYQYKYKPKTDGAYINAILNIERAQLLNDTRVEGDTTDYVAKAVETYKDILTAMPADRGAALQEWVAQGKKWLKAFNDSVRKSGKVDIEKLDNITETDISETIGWFPVWGKRQKYTGLLDTFRGINKERNPYKSWLRDGEWVPANQLGDPWQNMNRYMAFVTNNMGLNDMDAAAMDVYDRAGLLVDNTPTDATIRKRKLDSVKNKDELNKKFDEMVAEAKKEVEEQALTPAQYSDMMTQIYEESAIPETAEALSKDVLGTKRTELTQPIASDDRYKELIKKAKNYKTPERFEKMNNPIKGSEIWGEKPTSAFQLDSRGVRVNLFPNEAVKGTGITKQYLLNLFKDAYEQGVTETFPSYGSYTEEGRSFMDHLAEQGWVKKSGNTGYEIAPKITEWEKTSPLLDIYNAAHTPEAETQVQPQENSEEQWDEFWNNAPAQTRKDIRSELEKTSLQTGYGISDTRARLNAQVPGADVLDWSLLGRDHTNGLVPGGLYAGKNSPVKAYIMSVDDLVKLAGYDLDNAIPDMGKVIEDNINTNGIVPMLPAHIRGSGDGPEIWLKMRWGHNSDDVANWTDYLKTLKKRGIEKVPVAIDDARGDYNTTFYRVRNTGIAQKGLDNIIEAIDKATATGEAPEFTVRDISAALHVPGWTREKLRNRILRSGARISGIEVQNALDEADEYDWTKDKELNSLTDDIESVIEEKLGYIPQDITADVQQAFTEYGQIPFFRGQRGLGEFNMNDLSSTSQVGDAYWIAPNASYTDEYGKDKIMGTIPVKYFMSDKEKNEIVKRLSEEENRLVDKATELGRKEFLEKNKKVEANAPKEILSETGRLAEKQSIAWNFGLKLAESDSDKEIYIDNNRLMYEFEGDVLDSADENPSNWETKFTFRPLGKVWESPADANRAYDRGKELLSKKDLKRLRELQKLVDVSGTVSSYRALAEYAGKPVIDISEDGFASGTAFFYYKGVSPEFDEEIGKQLETQAKGTPDTSEAMQESQLEYLYETRTFPQFLEDLAGDDPIAKQKLADIKKLAKDIEGYIYSDPDLKAKRELDLDDKIEELIQLQRGKAPGLSEYVFLAKQHNLSKASKPMLAKWVLGKEPLLEQVHAWSIDDETYADIAEFYDLGEYIMPEEKQAWDAIDPTNFANVPTEPQFVQPRRKVTYEDYQKGLQADPEMAGRVRDSYRGAMANRLIKEATRATALAENYLGPYGYGADWQSYLNTSLVPDLQAAINQNMLPEEFQSFVQARMAQAMQDMAPYQSPEMLLKSRLDRVAEEWREWALKHIKAGRATQKELKEFANTHELNLPNDKRPLPSKIKHALWQIVQDGKKLPEISGLNPKAISKEMDKDLFYQMLDDTPLFQSAVKDKNELLDLISLEKNKETTDGFTMGAAATAAGLGGRYPITKFKNGKPYTRFIKYDTPGHLRIAEQTTKALNDKELLKEDGLISRFASMMANDFRLLVTGWDPSRAFPNLFRDTTSSFMKTRFISPKKQLQAALDLGDYTPAQRRILEKAIENAANAAANSSYNSAYRTSRSGMTEITKQYLSKNGASPMKRFFFNLRRDKRSIAEWPMEFFEGYSRRANARSLAAVQLRKDQKADKSYKEQMKNAVTAADWAGREYTANFQRKGELIGRTSKYVAYQSSAYAGLDGWLRAFINDPTTVSRNFAAFVLAYLVLLADTLSREETRKQYYRLSEYDRENQIVIGLGDAILTIPMDQTLAGMIFPYRRIMETLNGTDPVSFFEFVWGTLTAALPPDLSGFSEGDGFNLARGLQKLASQNMPNVASGILEASTGLDLYYGNQVSVSDETLKDYGIYSPTAGDYTTTGKDSEILRNVANATGIPQWQLQVMLENYGGNIGKYVLNILDKMAGAPEERQGGKDFADTVFNSFTGLDQDSASSAFYDGIAQLKKEKNALLQKINDYNEDLKTASGDTKIELQNKIQQAKRDYGTKVGDFVDKYVSAYEITGGLPKSQAQQVYFLFRLDDDDTIYQDDSVEGYYNNQALQQFKNQATALSAPILDKYYNNRRGNIYQDSDGVWRRYLPSASQAMRNSVYGTGEQQMVDLLNILEGKNSNLAIYRTRIKNLRSQAYEAGDWDTRDALAYDLDKKVIEAISPYIERYGAEYVLGNSDVLEYLSEWFIVPDDFIRSKKGKYVSLGNNASTQKAFVQPFIKYVFGLPTNFSSYNDTKITPKAVGEL